MIKKIAGFQNRSQPTQGNCSTDAIAALRCIPSVFPYDEWFAVMAAAKAAGIPFEDVDEWCSTAGNYNPKDVQSTWRSIKDSGGITSATLFHIAKQYGYKPTGVIDYAAIETQREQSKSRQVDADKEKLLKQQQAALKADEILNGCTSSTLDHNYLLLKRVTPRLLPWVDENGWLVIPVMDLQGNIHSLQFISPNGDKRFLSNSAIKGHFYQLWSRVQPSKAIVICEGYATGVTLSNYDASDCSVVVAFNAGNLLPVAKVFRAAFPDADIIIAGDCDTSGVGQKKAKEAALAVGGSYTIPSFQTDEHGSDFNDRWCLDNPVVAA